MSFIHEDFLLQSKAARRLYHDHAEGRPIFDYHCHIPPQQIAENRRFANLFEVWLAGDHYKWRAMRAAGVDEQFVTGSADPRDKFLAFARTVPQTLRNPLYHWTHLELKRVFGFDELLNEKTAPRIWDQANEMLQSDELRVHGILKKFNVALVCTTDDPADTLVEHRAIAASSLEARVLPAFRADSVLKTADVAAFNAYIDKLAKAAALPITNLDELFAALRARHKFFHENGCRLSDHGLDNAPAAKASEIEVKAIFAKLRAGQTPTPLEAEQYSRRVLVELARMDADADWTQQFHVGALRNANSFRLRQLGPDTGYDSIHDLPQAAPMADLFDQLDGEGKLARTIIYNLNPADNYAFATMIGNFQDGRTPGKLQYGSGWWFLDQKHGIEMQLEALSNVGLLSRFVGMLTDSRSFFSYPRHEYFRRVLCNMLGAEIEGGLIPADYDLVGAMVEDICHRNAKQYFQFPL